MCLSARFRTAGREEKGLAHLVVLLAPCRLLLPWGSSPVKGPTNTRAGLGEGRARGLPAFAAARPASTTTTAAGIVADGTRQWRRGGRDRGGGGDHGRCRWRRCEGQGRRRWGGRRGARMAAVETLGSFFFFFLAEPCGCRVAFSEDGSRGA